MAFTVDNTIKTAMLTALRDTLVSGTLEIQDAGNVVLAVFTLTNPGGTVAANVWTLAFAAGTVTAAATGTASKAQMKVSGGTVRVTGLTVGTSAADVILNSVAITSGG